MRVALIGNCQVTPMAAVIEAAVPGISCTPHEVFAMSEAACAAAAAGLDGMDAILSQPLSAPRYGRLATSALREDHATRRPLLVIHNLHFEGAIPDCTYVGRLGRRIPSPVSGYHSRIVRDAFLAGRSEAEALALLVSGTGTDPVRAWNRSLEELRAREAGVDIAFAAELEAHVRERNSFHVFNHPTIGLIAHYTGKVLDRLLGQQGRAIPAALPDELARKGRWPVWPWVAQKLGLPYSTAWFSPPGADPSAILPPAEFIAKCYAIYARQPRDALC